eukprot:10691792-Lingulodinium_polyedra.AAC.1
MPPARGRTGGWSGTATQSRKPLLVPPGRCSPSAPRRWSSSFMKRPRLRTGISTGVGSLPIGS